MIFSVQWKGNLSESRLKTLLNPLVRIGLKDGFSKEPIYLLTIAVKLLVSLTSSVSVEALMATGIAITIRIVIITYFMMFLL